MQQRAQASGLRPQGGRVRLEEGPIWLQILRTFTELPWIVCILQYQRRRWLLSTLVRRRRLLLAIPTVAIPYRRSELGSQALTNDPGGLLYVSLKSVGMSTVRYGGVLVASYCTGPPCASCAQMQCAMRMQDSPVWCNSKSTVGRSFVEF